MSDTKKPASAGGAKKDTRASGGARPARPAREGGRTAPGDDVETRTAALRPLLAAWWEGNARDLPWRFGRTTPWGVLVSEVMSQQTPMSRVEPCWRAWMERWPEPGALAAASPAEVITAWGRLGYPRRALALRECARVVAEEHGGVVPCDYGALVALPGVGDYTACAVLSFAYGVRAVVIDTNVRRVVVRAVTGVESTGGAAKAPERALIGRVLPEDAAESVVWNQSVMELGALVCTAKAPRCAECPVRGWCLFFERGLPGLGAGGATRPRQRYQGTDRQVRGVILAALRQAGPAGLSAGAVRGLWPDLAQCEACLSSLVRDGLVSVCADGTVRLPQ